MTAVVEALLAGLVDYAGLFPPAAQSMAHAITSYARYRCSTDAWMLGRFIVPASRLDELEAAAAALARVGPADAPWRISAIVGADVEGDIEAFARFNARQSAQAGSVGRVDSLEIKAGSVDDVAHLAARMPLVEALWFEVAVGAGLGAILEALGSMRAGAKLRAGGPTQESVPSSEAVARFLLGCVHAGIQFKATAGLHHAMRGRYRLTAGADSPSVTMHGFLNLFLAAVLAHQVLQHRYPEPEAATAVRALLDEEDERAFIWGSDFVQWRAHRFDLDEIREVRDRGARSFGSCSFEDPVTTSRAAIGSARLGD